MLASSYLEDLDSKLPAIQVLESLGWTYLSPAEALALRGGRLDRTVLTGVLRPWLEAHNRFETRGAVYPFSPYSLDEALRRLLDVTFDGLIHTNEIVYNLLTLGTSLDESVLGERKGRSLHYIDWEHWERNVFHVTAEFAVECRASKTTRRLDLVLFVNGIPFAVIECKRRDLDHPGGKPQVQVAIDYLDVCQQANEIPHLFQYAQVLLATSVNDVLFGTVGTQKKFWARWREQHEDVAAVQAAANHRLAPDTQQKLFASGLNAVADADVACPYFAAAGTERLPTEQDRVLWAMLRPARLLEFVYCYVVFDAGTRKVARYQQYFAVQDTLRRIEALHAGVRQGGVIWHTTGSGKSLTMVMLAKALAVHPGLVNARIVLVTDRIDLDRQLWGTFQACGKTAVRAKSGQHLAELITQGSAPVITTVIDKFETAAKRYKLCDPDPNTFLLVDEGHRSNYNETAALMRGVFPNGCYIAFTGTPLTKKEKNTATRFGGFIHRYTMREAVADGAVVPLVYEGRLVELEVQKDALDRWFERVTRHLSAAQTADLKRRMASAGEISRAEQRLKMIAFDIGEHFVQNFQGRGLKAQLAVDSRESAIRYRQFFEEFGAVEVAVIMSKPDLRVENALVKTFWQAMMDRHGTEKRYNEDTLAAFSRADGVEILIVVDRLLTGFDEPRNTVLYIDKALQEHALLQAIARVNRLFEGKDFGILIDYRGVLGKLNEALRTYDTLAAFDPKDVDMTGALIEIEAEIAQLPQRHTDLWAVFKDVANQRDREAMERHLADADLRADFYAALRAYVRTLAVALGSERFFELVTAQRIARYKADLALFVGLRQSVQQRYAETVDYSAYEQQVRKLMDAHIQAAPDVTVLTPAVNIFEVEAFKSEVARVKGAAAKADTIASRVQRTITERMDEDPVMFKRFATLVQDAIDDYRTGRIDAVEYLKRIQGYQDAIVRGFEEGIPEPLRGRGTAQAFFGIVAEVLERYPQHDAATRAALAVTMAVAIEDLVTARSIRDWMHNADVQQQMTNAIDDYLFEVRDRAGLDLAAADMDMIIERCLDIARKRAAR
ncbi:HsdR family type I site-specific deoxyribonuclease [uncultured Thiodictyon sp.]|jgi:type I restriction enzyme R subunit|uniref:type I restriction endonuclease subunit R n=1 Tax=uncultured Thiodictyon sp. TaxID=1846217 RepID=UPI0025EEA09B|nr:HsdR family type I site-specific deoxyribonuclease [uncultured Thiodictyon sp.]